MKRKTIFNYSAWNMHRTDEEWALHWDDQVWVRRSAPWAHKSSPQLASAKPRALALLLSVPGETSRSGASQCSTSGQGGKQCQPLAGNKARRSRPNIPSQPSQTRRREREREKSSLLAPESADRMHCRAGSLRLTSPVSGSCCSAYGPNEGQKGGEYKMSLADVKLETEKLRVQIECEFAEMRTREYEPPNYLPTRKTRVDWEAECWKAYNADTLKTMYAIRERMRKYWYELRNGTPQKLLR